MGEIFQMKPLVTSIIYSFLGVFILVVSFYIVEKITPENVWKEIVQNKNTAVAIIAAAYILAIALIIASAIH